LVTVGFMGPALLLAFVFHQGVAAVATAVVGTLPALYLAWAVVPAARKPGPRLSLVPAVPGWVDRGELAEVVSALTGTGSGAVALTTGLVGAGGFGKTTLEQIFTGKESTELGAVPRASHGTRGNLRSHIQRTAKDGRQDTTVTLGTVPNVAAAHFVAR
jgi:hypothetical protein